MTPQDPDDLSPAAAACLLLVWLTPTDRALSGWTPYDASITSLRGLSGDRMLSWLNGQLSLRPEEHASRSRLVHGPPNGMNPYQG